MISSMTGFGTAQGVEDGVAYSLEIRALNSRYLKLALKLPEPLQFAEAPVERLLRNRLQRGSVTYTLRARFDGGEGVGTVNQAVLQRYVDDLCRVRLCGDVAATLDLGAVAGLPGVCETPEFDQAKHAAQLSLIERLTSEALDALVRMRMEEGEALCADLISGCEAILRELEVVTKRSPAVIDEYHERLKQRVSRLLERGGLKLEEEGLMREVALYAERCDISEEITRLSSHLDQFSELCRQGEHVGRRLDFVAQELLREANTISSKSNDATIARCVVEIKACIERLKEQVQNVE